VPQAPLGGWDWDLRRVTVVRVVEPDEGTAQMTETWVMHPKQLK
jgi:hypothetical protein